MPSIRFTADPALPRDLAHLAYKKGAVVTLSTDQCERWIRRGVAVYVQPRPFAIIESKPADLLGPVEESAAAAAEQGADDATETLVAEPEPFHPETAPIEEVREFLVKGGRQPRANTGEARLREMAADLLAANSKTD